MEQQRRDIEYSEAGGDVPEWSGQRDGHASDRSAATPDKVEEPGRLMRIASTVQTLLHEVQTTELDEAARQRLTEIHNRMVADVGEILSDDLSRELREFSLDVEGATPSGSELRVMQAQLAGWLQGLFHGIQASIATQQMAAQQQLARMREQSPGQLPGGKPGQYL